ncbi:hypothetical protein [Bartonella henselae]|nr:hypothetical protein [Bartonella henselae]MDM9996878.1 hypothetical protein [Bartonella henselae]UJM43787.1 hypothetical protein KAE73_03440 [Bartonella henselae]
MTLKNTFADESVNWTEGKFQSSIYKSASPILRQPLALETVHKRHSDASF